MTSTLSSVLSNQQLAGGVYLMRLEEKNAASVKPGQFYMLALNHPLLPRPLSVCQTGDGWVDFCYVVCGAGTAKLAAMRPGGTLRLTGPLGNGFDMDEINRYERPAVVSGGAGVAPFVEVVRRMKRPPPVFCGFSDTPYLTDRLSEAGARVQVAVEKNGGPASGGPASGRPASGGMATADANRYTGFVTDIFDPSEFDVALACGPEGFSRAVVQKCRDAGTPLYISMDRHMACGVGACLVCVCATTAGNKRCCADGPVFRGEDLRL